MDQLRIGRRWGDDTFLGLESVVTGNNGRFQIAPPVEIRFNATRPGPSKLEALCFADASFGRVACQFVDPSHAAEPLEVTLRESRLVRVRVAPSSVAATPNMELSLTVTSAPHPSAPNVGFYFIMRSQEWRGQPVGSFNGGVLEQALPPGTYGLNLELRDAEAGRLLGEAERDLVVPTGAEVFNPPPLALQASRSRQMAGKPARDSSH